MIICSSLERHSLSLLIRVTVKASQFMDSSRLGQYTNSSSAFGNQENKLSYSVIKYLFLSFLANQPIMFAIFQTTQLTFQIDFIELILHLVGFNVTAVYHKSHFGNSHFIASFSCHSNPNSALQRGCDPSVTSALSV